MADLSKIVCLEQDCRHGMEQTSGSGSGNDTYTKAEIDSKDADIRAAASEAKSAANNAQSVNQTQDGQIKALQGAVDNLHNYEHPAYSAHQLGFYKFANDAIGSVSDAQPVTKKDITDLGIPESDTTYKLVKYTDVHGGYGDGSPSVVLKDATGKYTEIVVPNAQTRSFGWNPIYNVCYGNLQNTDKYASLCDILFTGNMDSASADIYTRFYTWDNLTSYIFYVHIRANFGNIGRAEILVSSEFSPPNVKWTVLYNTVGVPEGFEKRTCVIRICIDQESMKSIPADLMANAVVEFPTDTDGGMYGRVQKTDSVNKYLESFHDNDIALPTAVILSSENASNVAFTGDYNDLSNKPTIPDISGKQDKSTAVTHTANTAVGSATKPVYIAANGAATPISHSINSDVPANAKFTDTTYSDATTSKPGLMTAADKKKLDGMDLTKYLLLAGGVMTGDIDIVANQKELLVGSRPTANDVYATPVVSGFVHKADTMTNATPSLRSYIGSYRNTSLNRDYLLVSVRHRNGYQRDGGDGSSYGMMIYSELTSDGNLYWNKQAGKDKWLGERRLLDSTNYSNYAAKSDHTHAMITNSALWVSGADNTAKWVRLGTLISSGNFSNGVIRVWTGDGANGRSNQNSSFEIQIKDGWQSTLSAVKACGVTVYRINCSDVKVKVIPTAHDTYTVWAYFPWGYWNGNYAVYGKYKSWTSQHLIQSDEPEGTGADTAYYDQAFLTSTVAKATALAETAWTAVPATGAAETVGRSIKYLKSGNTVFVQGSISFSASLNTPVCGKMPSDCLPNQKLVFTGWDIIGAPASFAIILDTDGKLSFLSPGTTAYWFKDHRAYSFNFSYHIN